LKNPILFLVFNRPYTTSKVFEKICQAKPPRLYVAGDGPRKNFSGEEEKVNQVRDISTRIDWPCELKTLFRDKNLGCKKGVSKAISWFFEHEEQGIILEDDCVPHSDFFIFCENLLDRYSKEHKVTTITGSNFQSNKRRGDASYYFSKYNHCWGWASWRRSWKNYDGEIKFWPRLKDSKDWHDFITDNVERKYWNKIFDLVYAGKIDSWAYPWLISTWYKNGLTATPNVNLISNIGFGEDATHTKNKNDKNSNIKTSKLGILKHPKAIQKNEEADNWTFNYHFDGKNLRVPYIFFFIPIRFYKYIYKKLRVIKKNYL
jgi:hypothetical protein